MTLLRLARMLNFVKALLDREMQLPRPAPFLKGRLARVGDRWERGKILLQWFLHDGRLRGLAPDGEVYEHVTSLQIAQAFRDDLLRVKIRGVVR